MDRYVRLGALTVLAGWASVWIYTLIKQEQRAQTVFSFNQQQVKRMEEMQTLAQMEAGLREP